MHSSGPFGWVKKDENESFLLYGIWHDENEGNGNGDGWSFPLKAHQKPSSQVPNWEEK